MGYALKHEREHTEMECGECGIVFYVPEHWREQRQAHGNTFYCPNGHPRVYRESTVDKLRRQLKDATDQVTWHKARADKAEQTTAKAKATTKRLERRIAAGVCPCCHRTVAQLARHIATKHPEYPKAPGV
jgi:hypothetical protein